MSFYLEETCNIPFDFAYAKLAEDVIAFCLSHENFPYEAEVNLTLTDNEEIHRINLFWKRRVKMILIRIREKSCLEILLYRSIKC